MTEALLKVSEHGGFRFLEGPSDRAVLATADDSRLILEKCIEGRVSSALLYASNMPPGFFDLSSRDAGTVLQKLRNYRLRMAVVCAPGAVKFSTMFPEMAAEEKSRGYFGIFETRDATLEWLIASASVR